MKGVRQRITRLAEERGKTQLDVEKAAGVAHSTYNGMWDRGTVTLERIERIASFLEVDVVDLLMDRATPPGSGQAAEPIAPHGQRPKFLEERIAFLEAEVRKLKEKARPK